MSEEHDIRVLRKLEQEAGDTVLRALDDPDVLEVMLNPDGTLWQDRIKGEMSVIGLMDEVQATKFIGTTAYSLGKHINESDPILEGEFPLYNSRFTAVIPPVTSGPTFSIRKFSKKIFTLEDYVQAEILTERHKDVIENAILSRWNIIVSGGAGSGKTTLTNALSHATSKLTPHHRIVAIEDTRELKFSSKNVVAARTSKNKSMQHLLRATLRLRPTRIVVGEVRGGEALTMLKAWITHTGGFCTIHANNARAGLTRIAQCCQEAVASPMEGLIGQVVDLVIAISRDEITGSRRVNELLRVVEYKDGEYITESL